MEASEMLDVLHYFLEEDLYIRSPEETATKSTARQRIYREFYNRDYKYAQTAAEGSSGGLSTASGEYETFIDSPIDDSMSDAEMDPIKVFNPKQNPAKPYVPPTDFDASSSQPFGNILDSPLK